MRFRCYALLSLKNLADTSLNATYVSAYPLLSQLFSTFTNIFSTINSILWGFIPLLYSVAPHICAFVTSRPKDVGHNTEERWFHSGTFFYSSIQQLPGHLFQKMLVPFIINFTFYYMPLTTNLIFQPAFRFESGLSLLQSSLSSIHDLWCIASLNCSRESITKSCPRTVPYIQWNMRYRKARGKSVEHTNSAFWH